MGGGARTMIFRTIQRFKRFRRNKANLKNENNDDVNETGHCHTQLLTFFRAHFNLILDYLNSNIETFSIYHIETQENSSL